MVPTKFAFHANLSTSVIIVDASGTHRTLSVATGNYVAGWWVAYENQALLSYGFKKPFEKIY